jgi:ATP synthase F1 delta subunit
MAGRGIHKAAAVYAKTLLELAGEKGVREEILAEAGSLHAVFSSAPALARALKSPALSAEKKTKLLAPVKDRASDLLKRLIRLLEIKNRLVLLPDICGEILRMDEERRRVRRARVVSAVALAPEQMQRLSEGLSARSGGYTYQLKNEVDAGLIAGFRVEEEDRVTDASLLHKLNLLRLKLAA